jgi:ParB-like chromosome segregation protein Spo0J
MPDPLDVFAANLKQLREERGWSQERVAHESGLNPSHVAKIERTEREPGGVGELGGRIAGVDEHRVHRPLQGFAACDVGERA